MPVSFSKKSAPAGEVKTTAPKGLGGAKGNGPFLKNSAGGKTGKKAEKASTTKPSWLKTGAEARAAMDEADAAAEKAKEESGRLFRFFIPENDEATITFLDGDLDDDGRLMIPMLYEHRVLHAGKWTNFLCIADAEPCPLCENGDRPALVGVMTVINHTPYTIKNGPNAGKQIANRKQLYVATRSTIKKLQKIASKKGTLRMHSYEVSRSEDKSPRVGDMFMHIHEWGSVEELKDYLLGNGDDNDNPFPVKADEVDDLVEPADYAYEMIYRDGEELAKMGLTTAAPIGHGSHGGASTSMKGKI